MKCMLSVATWKCFYNFKFINETFSSHQYFVYKVDLMNVNDLEIRHEMIKRDGFGLHMLELIVKTSHNCAILA